MAYKITKKSNGKYKITKRSASDPRPLTRPKTLYSKYVKGKGKKNYA